MSRELKNGMIGGFISMGWMILIFFSKQENGVLGNMDSYLCLIILAATIYLTILGKRDKELDGAIGFKQAFMSGMVATFMIGIMVGAYKFVYVKYLNPGVIDEMAKQAREIYEQLGSTPDQINTAEQSARAMYSPFGQLTYGIGVTMLYGAVVSLICAVVMQRKPKAVSE